MLTLISHALCPYVQRAAISLAEKQTPFERRTIDLADKPDWFTALSPLGKVPVLLVEQPGETTVPIFESAVILEYLEDTQPHPLHPAAPLERARHRAWIEFGSAILNGIARLYSAPDEEAFVKASESLAGMFSRVESELAARTSSPWFFGEAFSLVDAVYGPIFRYFDNFDQIGDFGILRDRPTLAAWRQALANRASVKGAVSDDYPARLDAFLAKRRSHLSVLMGPTDHRPISAA
ncbi:glutathione S-transferase family protein [Cucumibacter marinus]|uniref:glutathione S-transferase family protein n=1 Tax=Cucumibacter marinus TaxID=1121252 RepID=UPI00041C08D3|nr:glutathione S-transferase family protein [Cucumibacter marinus]